jgi:hypothetical protein
MVAASSTVGHDEMRRSGGRGRTSREPISAGMVPCEMGAMVRLDIESQRVPTVAVAQDSDGII